MERSRPTYYLLLARWTLVLLAFLFVACEESDLTPEQIMPEQELAATEQHYIYLSHTRRDSNDSIFRKVYDLDFEVFDLKILGGDLAQNSFENEEILSHLDRVFDLKSVSTLWSIGNHDKTTDSIFRAAANKDKFNLHQRDDISFITLNSQDSLSSIIGEQREFLYTTLDTLTTRHVVILTHKLIFMDQHPAMDDLINITCNGSKGDCYYCTNTNNFTAEIYPKLLELKGRGKNVLWIGGDLGIRKSTFEYTDGNGIVFLGNGMSHSKNDNQVLLFTKTAEQLEYRFIYMDELLRQQAED